ncbi:hypothetical protein NYY89_20825, partial [Acinetobacter baumannii]|nr:hypothetical protein [Acinetobacter baumannii]
MGNRMSINRIITARHSYDRDGLTGTLQPQLLFLAQIIVNRILNRAAAGLMIILIPLRQLCCELAGFLSQAR